MLNVDGLHPSQALRVARAAAFAGYEMQLAAACAEASRRKVEALIEALLLPRRHHPAVCLLAGCVVAWRIFKAVRKAVR